MSVQKPSTTRDILAGMKAGLGFGLAFMAIAAVIVFVVKDDFFERAPAHVTPLLLFGIYPIGGLVSGAVAGYLRPLASSRSRAMFVGAVSAVPLCAGFVWLVVDSFDVTDPSIWITIALGAAILGGMAGGVLWDQGHRWSDWE